MLQEKTHVASELIHKYLSYFFEQKIPIETHNSLHTIGTNSHTWSLIVKP